MVSLDDKRFYSYDSVYFDVVKYFKELFGVLGEMASDELMLSLASWRLQKTLPKSIDVGRIRKHVLLFWRKGWLKSTILRVFSDLLPNFIRKTFLSDASRQSLTGSAVGDKFKPPEFKVNDIIIIPEMTSIFDNFDSKFIGAFLTALEEGRIAVSYVKFSNLSEEEIVDAFGEYEIVIRNGRIEYDVDSVVWCGAHTYATLERHLRDAFIDRFTVVSPEPDVFNNEFVNKVLGFKRDLSFEISLRANIEKKLNSIKFDIDDYNYIFSIVKEVCSDFYQPISPRFISEVQKTGVSFYAWNDTASKSEIVEYITDKIIKYSKASIPVDDKMVSLLRSRPVSVDELKEFSDYGFTDIYKFLKRIGAKPITRGNVTKYYLDEIKYDV